MNNKSLIAKYGQAQSTVSKIKQIIMLYDGMIKFMVFAKEAAEKGDLETRFNKTEAASKIITGLQASLDFEASREVSESLDAFYSEVFIKMMLFNVNNDPSLCEEVIQDLTKMRDAWKDVENDS